MSRSSRFAVESAYGYYFYCAIRNRIKNLRQRIRRPRYVVGFILIGLYFVFLYNRVGLNTPYFLAGLYFMLWAMNWILLPNSSSNMARALAFRLAEIQQLFVAPLSRRRLLQFKLMQNQASSLIMATIFTLLCRRIEGTSVGFLFIGIFLVSNLLNLHSSLLRILVDYFRRRQKLSVVWMISTAFALGLGAIIWLSIQKIAVNSDSTFEFVSYEPAASIMQFMLALFGPALATSWREFFTGLWLPLVLIAVHALLFFNIKFPMEDNAIVSAELLDKFRQQGARALRKRRTSIDANKGGWGLQQLAPTGPQWRAVFWKNWTSIVRLDSRLAKRLLLFVIAAIAVSQFLSQEVKSTAGFVLLIIVPYTLLIGPALLRNDLRIDIPHFDVIKSMPIVGRQLIFGEIMAPQVFLVGIQVVLLLAAALLISRINDTAVTTAMKLHAFAIAVPACFALTFFMLTLQNLMALYLPGLTRLGRRVQQGFDQFGQNFLGALVRLLAIIVAMIPAAVIGGIVGAIGEWVFSLPRELTSILAAGAASATIFGESLLLIYMSDSRYRYFDLSEENIKAEE